jgi:hypothetical protein
MLEGTALRLFLDNKNFSYTMIVIQQHYVKDKDKDTLFKVAIYLAIRLV